MPKSSKSDGAVSRKPFPKIILKNGKRPRLRRDLKKCGDPILVTTPDIHTLYGYSQSATRHAIRERGFPPGFKDGMRHLWFKADIDAYFARLAQGGAS